MGYLKMAWKIQCSSGIFPVLGLIRVLRVCERLLAYVTFAPYWGMTVKLVCPLGFLVEL